MAEEKGYWFSTENGTHIHAEEGESKEQAMGKKFKNFGAKKEGKKEEPGLKTESRSMINENQANDPRVLADKLEYSEEDAKKFAEQGFDIATKKEMEEIFGNKGNDLEKESPLDSLYKKSKEKNLSFERMLLNDILDNPDKYNEFTLGNRQYKRNGKAFDMYEDGRHIWTGTYSSAANSVNDYYEKNHKD